MALKAFYAKLEDAPETARTFYKQKDGRFVLDVEGMVLDEDHDALNTKLAEFRDSNIALKRERDDLKAATARFEGIDPAEVKTLREKVAGFEKTGVTKPDDVAAQIAAAVDKAIAPINAKLEAAEKAKAAADGELQRKNLEDTIWTVGVTAGIAEAAKPDFLGRAARLWQWKDGKPVAMNGEDAVFSKRKGKVTEPLSPEEWVMEWLPAENATHLFKPNTGSGAQNNGRGTSGARLIANDLSAIGNNLEALAKGEMAVQGAS